MIEGGSFYEIDNSNISQIPAFDSEFSVSPPSTSQPLIDWGIVTAPQDVYLGASFSVRMGLFLTFLFCSNSMGEK